jgi:pSer/pThr/pTyr-binding forkhead associated (FHA) protein
MDIALYKWIRNDPSHAVTIGKSVDCSIQLSWDINGQVAPVQAEIKRHLDSILLTALEDGVFVNDKPLAQGDDIWLYHGRKFTIGNTTFTYIEKDL